MTKLERLHLNNVGFNGGEQGSSFGTVRHQYVLVLMNLEGKTSSNDAFPSHYCNFSTTATTMMMTTTMIVAAEVEAIAWKTTLTATTTPVIPTSINA